MAPARPAPDPEHLWRSPEPIVLLPHDPAWLAEGLQEARRILDACGGALLRVEHIGSTSVPGLDAKPVIDLLPILRSFDEGYACVEPMRALGYWYAGDFGIAGRHLFIRGSPRTHHAHMLLEDSREARRHLAVRDTLRARPDRAQRYAELKTALTAQFGSDRERYAEAKGAFMRELFDATGLE
jgi:GrpB-like predicted nucleotidyltransferase (UPF0157 family)